MTTASTQTTDTKARRRRELVDAVIDGIGAKSLADVSLRALAEAAGTSHRMLLYYFGSKDALLDDLRRAVDDRVSLSYEWRPPDDPIDLIAEFWRRITEDSAANRATGQLLGLALLEPDVHGERELNHLGQSIALIEDIVAGIGVDPSRAAAVATFVQATLVGFQTHHTVGVDPERVRAGLEEFMALLRMWVPTLVSPAEGTPPR